LQHGVREQAHRNALLALRLVLELRLTLQLTEGRHRREQPVELGVLNDVRLHENDALFRIESGRVETHRHVEGELREARGIIGLRDGVQIDDAE